MDNPFTLTFGKKPVSFISRERQTVEIIESFLPEHPEKQVVMLTGVRGSGKTVALTNIANELRSRNEWIVVDLNPERDMLQMLAAELSNRPGLGQLFKDASINLSLLGFGVNIDAVPPITDISVALDKMLSVITKRNKKVLITIDEATSTPRMREFAAQFQIYLRKDYNIYLLMTGLYENVNELQNEKALTFLYRAPKENMEPLNKHLIALKYGEVFGLSGKEAMAMAEMTSGYAYAFQLLGYLCFKKQLPYSDVLDEYDAYLGEYVYEKIWNELSEQDRLVAAAITHSPDTKVESIRDKAGMNSSVFSVYRSRLLKKGIITQIKYGHVDFSLPRFREFVRSMID